MATSLTHKYIPRVERAEENLFIEEYYSNTDTKIYINNTEQTEIAYISYSLQEQLKPLYGYASRTFDDVAIGNRIVTGAFKVSIRNPEEQSSIDDIIERSNEEEYTIEDYEKYNASQEENASKTEWIGKTVSSSSTSSNTEDSVISIYDLTHGQYRELYYNSAGNTINGTFVGNICELLHKCGINLEITNTYTSEVADAVKEFQDMIGETPTGIVTTTLYEKIVEYAAGNINDVVEDDSDNSSNEAEETESDSPHYISFFSENNSKIHRQNHNDIKIVFGNNTITKTIKNVFMRSVTVEVDTSGNPISDVYEFIARDITESDESSDNGKYDTIYSGSSSDIQYKFSTIGID